MCALKFTDIHKYSLFVVIHAGVSGLSQKYQKGRILFIYKGKHLSCCEHIISNLLPLNICNSVFVIYLFIFTYLIQLCFYSLTVRKTCKTRYKQRDYRFLQTLKLKFISRVSLINFGAYNRNRSRAVN